MTDLLPDISGLRDFYGTSVHHCPYCDGWEHRDHSLVALGNATGSVKLAATLRGWSDRVTACTNGESILEVDRMFLKRLGIACREEKIRELRGQNGSLQSVAFNSGASVPCDALFFSSGQGQRSQLPALLGCDRDDKGLIIKRSKQCTSVAGVYIAGDADGDVQFSVVAAAEGAVAATAIHQALLDQDQAD
jgi:thioredoxin reductase